jgi:hypothetical protein
MKTRIVISRFPTGEGKGTVRPPPTPIQTGRQAVQWTGYVFAIAALLSTIPLLAADRDGHHESHSAPGVSVERFSHGSIRHSDSHVFRPPTPVFHGNEHHVEGGHDFVPRHDVFVHHDVDVDFHHPQFWSDFGFHRHVSVLPQGFLTLHIGGAPYYYWGGVYYQPSDGGYVEVYPPVGASVPQPPEGSIQVYAGGQTYYYAGGAFYVQQPDGQFVIAPTPIGVVVPELPPGAVEVNANGRTAYQFNGIYYQPIFVNGVTQYQTFTP